LDVGDLLVRTYDGFDDSCVTYILKGAKNMYIYNDTSPDKETHVWRHLESFWFNEDEHVKVTIVHVGSTDD